MPDMRGSGEDQYGLYGRSLSAVDKAGKVFGSRVFERSGNEKRGNAYGSRGYGK